MFRIRTFALMVRADIRSRVQMTFDIEREAPKPPEPEPPPPEPEPEEPTPEPEKVAEKEIAPPPAAAEAAKVLTTEADPNAPLDLTGFTIVTGNADRAPGGLTASSGTSKRAVFDRTARADGDGEAKKPSAARPGPVAAAEDLSRPPQIAGGRGWNNCPWPAEADVSQTNYQRVPLLITVSADGNAEKVVVLKDDGLGFGSSARACALRERFAPALDKTGKPTTGSFKVNVTFKR
jgi:periplasmic protein TonB